MRQEIALAVQAMKRLFQASGYIAHECVWVVEEVLNSCQTMLILLPWQRRGVPGGDGRDGETRPFFVCLGGSDICGQGIAACALMCPGDAGHLTPNVRTSCH